MFSTFKLNFYYKNENEKTNLAFESEYSRSVPQTLSYSAVTAPTRHADARRSGGYIIISIY